MATKKTQTTEQRKPRINYTKLIQTFTTSAQKLTKEGYISQEDATTMQTILNKVLQKHYNKMFKQDENTTEILFNDNKS